MFSSARKLKEENMGIFSILGAAIFDICKGVNQCFWVKIIDILFFKSLFMIFLRLFMIKMI